MVKPSAACGVDCYIKKQQNSLKQLLNFGD